MAHCMDVGCPNLWPNTNSFVTTPATTHFLLSDYLLPFNQIKLDLQDETINFEMFLFIVQPFTVDGHSHFAQTLTL